MPFAVYQAAIIALVQAIKANTTNEGNPSRDHNHNFLTQALLFAVCTDTIEPEGMLLKQLGQDYHKLLYSPTFNWAEKHEMCRDFLGMLDVPYAER